MNIKSVKMATCLLLICATSSCGGFPESTFALASGCRLPRWFNTEAGAGRQISGRVELYVRKQGREAQFILYDGEGNQIANTVGALDGLGPLHLKSQEGKDVTYDVVSVGNIRDTFKYEYEGSRPSICMMDIATTGK